MTQAGTSDAARTGPPSAMGQLWRTASAIERRSSRAAFVQPGMYVALTIGLLLGSVFLHNSLRVAQLNAVLTTSQPLLLPMFLTTTLFSIYVASRVALEITRERANRTLEVLFYGPVDANAFLLGHWIGGLKIYAVGLVLIVVWMNLVMWLLNIAFDLSLLALLGASLLSTAAMTAFGMLVGSLGGRSRNTLILFISVVLLFVVIQAADVVVRDIIPMPEGATANDPLITLRVGLSTMTQMMGWISPYAQLQSLSNDLLDTRPLQAIQHLLVMTVQALLLFALSVGWLRRARVTE